MTVSTDGQICYGILFDEDFDFPWDEKGDIEDWWYEDVNGYKPPFELYDEEGEYINGIEPPKDKIDKYYDHRLKFEELHPLSVQLVNVCSHDYPQYILAHPDSVKVAHRGYPETIEPDDLRNTDDWYQVLCGFCDKYGVAMPDEPKWWLSSYWG